MVAIEQRRAAHVYIYDDGVVGLGRCHDREADECGEGDAHPVKTLRLCDDRHWYHALEQEADDMAQADTIIASRGKCLGGDRSRLGGGREASG